MSRYSHNTVAIVLKRHNYSDADRFITLLTPEGKVSSLARGVRRLKSRKRAALEPVSLVKVGIDYKNDFSYIREAVVTDSLLPLRSSLNRLTQAVQLCEIVDHLVYEGSDFDPKLYQQIETALWLMAYRSIGKQELLGVYRQLLEGLGFGYPDSGENGLQEHIESITQKPMRTKLYFLSPSHT